MISNIRQRLEDFQSLGQTEQEVLTNESALSKQKLSDLEGAIPVLIQSISQQQGVFARSVDTALANVHFPVAVAEASPRSIGFLRDLVAWGSEGGSAIVGSAASQKIDSLKANYTMESERNAHSAALTQTPAPASAAAAETSIELFGELESPSPASSGSACEIFSESKPCEDQPRPAELAVGEVTPLELEHPLAPEKASVSQGLGDNVEMF
jgi:hypothetical protein